MSHMEHSERAGRQGQRRRHYRWSAPEHFHNNSRMHGFQHYDGFKAPRLSSQPVSSEGKQHGHIPMLDGLALEHMSQDCSSLKNHLLKLKSLLQLEEADSPADAAEEKIEDNSTVLQLQELIKEVQELREELGNRDRTIAQLTLQCQQLQQQQQQEQMPAQGRQVRCQCHHQRAPSSLQASDQQMDKRVQRRHDKATQTYWRPSSHTPQILQPLNPCLKEQHHQGRLVRTPFTEGRSDPASARSEEGVRAGSLDHPPERCTADAPGPADPEQLSHLLRTQLHWPDSARQGVTGRDGAASEAQCGLQSPAVSSGSTALTCPRVLQPPRLYKHVSLLALKPAGSSGCPFSSGPLRTRQLLPPPSRGLPCFNAGPQVRAQSVCRTSLLQPRGAAEPYRDLRHTVSSPVQLNQGKLREPATAKIPIPASRSCLPKPKIS